MRTINASLFKARCLALMDQVAAEREQLVILKRGKPLVVLAPLPRQRPESPFGIGCGGRIVGELVAPQEVAREELARGQVAQGQVAPQEVL